MCETSPWPTRAGSVSATGLALLRCRRRARRAGLDPASLSFGRGTPLPRLKNEGGEMRLGQVFLAAGTRLWAYRGGVLSIADGTVLDEGVEIVAWERVDIAARCTIGLDVLIMDTDLHSVAGRPVRNKPVKLGEGVVVGCRSIILKGVSVGAGAVIRPGSIVTRDIPAGGEVGPELARTIK